MTSDQLHLQLRLGKDGLQLLGALEGLDRVVDRRLGMGDAAAPEALDLRLDAQPGRQFITMLGFPGVKLGGEARELGPEFGLGRA
ncbi:MAG: hypothetical protein EOS79_08405 [Mesorhizobium sp.]|nr:MAG: hypothetical protein EOS79_08405 [Mesorhizobium sp.]